MGSCTKPNTSNYDFWAVSDPKFGYSVTVKRIQEIGGNITAQFSFVPFNECEK